VPNRQRHFTAEVDAASGIVREQDGLQRRLSQRQLTMIAIGGAIGVGLFLGSSVTIELAGPGVIVTYLLSALIAMVVAYSLAEMAVVHPVSGSFGIYAEKYLSHWAGFCVRATYGLVQIIAIGAEVTAVAIYFAFWFPSVPGWTWVVLVSAGLVVVNSMQVGNFGEFEYWFAMIKVVAILAFIAVGLALITGLGSGHAIGLANLTQNGGFFPHGLRGVWLALTLAITSYMGVEVIAVTAGGSGTGKIDSARDADDCVSADLLLCVCDRSHACDDPVEPHREHKCERKSLRTRLRDRGNSVCAKHHESGGDHGGALEREYQSVSFHADVIFTFAWSICAGLAESAEQQRRTPSRARHFRRRHGGSDPFGNIRPQGRVPAFVRHCGRRHVLCVDRDSADASSLPAVHQPPNTEKLAS